MRIPIYQVDAFTSRVFAGNPAAVCPLTQWLDESTMQAIAAENNLAETAFFVANGKDYDIRWFTPTIEMALCGHATLASGYMVFERLSKGRDEVVFNSQSGPLVVKRQGTRLALDFPAWPAKPIEPPAKLAVGLGIEPRRVFAAQDYLAVFETEDEIRALKPRMDILLELDLRGVIATAPGRDADFVSRFFAPRAGVPEDSVTGSAHCTLIPYWSERLGKTELHARQLSPRGGELWCEHRGDRVIMAGEAVLYLEGSIEV